MNDLERVSKLIGKLQSLITLLEQHPDMVIHQQVDQSYFMQKCSELQFMQDQLKGALAKKETFENLLYTSYREVAHTWRHDLRWVRKYLAGKKKPIL